MRRFSIRLAIRVALAAVLLPGGGNADAQQATTGVGLGQLNHGFFEQSGVGFGFRGPGFFFQQNGFGQALPQFGGFAPNAGASGGFAVNHGRNQANFNFAFGQGARSSFVSQTPSVTIGNGGFGSFSAGTWTPFVIGSIPVVGDAPVGGVPFGPAGPASLLEERLSRLGSEFLHTPSPPSAENSAPVAVDPALDPSQRNLVAAQGSSGGAADLSVAQIKQLRASQRAGEARAAEVEIEGLIRQAEASLQASKPRVARIYLQQAARRAEGARKEQ